MDHFLSGLDLLIKQIHRDQLTCEDKRKDHEDISKDFNKRRRGFLFEMIILYYVDNCVIKILEFFFPHLRKWI